MGYLVVLVVFEGVVRGGVFYFFYRILNLMFEDFWVLFRISRVRLGRRKSLVRLVSELIELGLDIMVFYLFFYIESID